MGVDLVEPAIVEHSHDLPDDFLQRNGAFVLSLVGLISACIAGVLAYFLKSRCKTISCLGMKCDRTPLKADEIGTVSSA